LGVFFAVPVAVIVTAVLQEIQPRSQGTESKSP